MNKHPRYEHTLEDLFLHVFVYVDDWLKANEERLDLPTQATQVASYSELFTVSLVGEMMAQPFETVWYWLVQQNHRDLFPYLPEYSRYHRVLRNAEKLWAELACSVAGKSYLPKLIDSKPLPVAKGRRQTWAKLPEACYGFSTMGWVYGFKLHAVVNLDGLFERWSIAPANEADVAVARTLLDGCEDEVVLGDKAYLGSSVVTPKRDNQKQQGAWSGQFGKARKRIESSFSSLVRSLNLHAAQVKTFWSLRAKINLKIAAFNLLHSG
ncbi:MAG: IS982 family transposase, partial [Deinococcota bacterium]|nr:IS982 family transposase [Deinococcota bacterium]